ncbi:probable 28S ribosomal protein S10, mitochondrial [Oppia nitens]|uniref:probable 28S ribosomal protein S10, mitochondrial n=1 Tax=Oppia nitens TaxID=1686743 RepID=UPI0023DBD9A0|nr:probable 28S ribosomal protein S10, mitochondrial [Oppia nitens]
MNKIFANLLKSRFNCQTNDVFVRHVRSHTIKGVDEPKYLDYLKPQIPYYSLINVQIRGYDFAVLESYGRYIHILLNKLGVNVVKYWCSPHQSIKYESLKPQSEVSESQFTLNLYERNVQIEHLSAKMAPLLLEILYSSAPVGVQLNVHPHHHILHEENRFIPDLQLAAFKAELKELKGSQESDIN